MLLSIRSRFVPLLASVLLANTLPAFAQADVLTWHNDNQRTGQNLSETTLTLSNVRSSTFGKLFQVSVDGKVDAQPLYLSNVAIPNRGTHNIVIAATEHDSVYAFDAATGTVYWHRSVLSGGETPSDKRNCNQVQPEIGITATPVIDRASGPHGTIYLVAMSKDTAGNYHHRLHALDLTTGAEESAGPREIVATYPGTGDNSSNGTVTFNPAQVKDRPGLLLLNGNVYTTWGSHCDVRPYSGWIIGYSESTLQQTTALNFAPNGNDAAPWNAGAGPAADHSGHIFIALGNGTFDTKLTPQGFPSQGDFGNSLVELSTTNGKLAPLDYWTMYNSNPESTQDTDLGSGGVMLLPNFLDSTGKTRYLAVVAGKDTNLYVGDRTNLGKYDATTNGTLYQEVAGALPNGMWSSPAYFNGRIYYGPVGGHLLAFPIRQARVANAPTSSTSTSFGYPGTTPSISAHGTSNAILWAVQYTSTSVLHAYDATNLAHELYNSNQASNSRDHFGQSVKFTTPTIANGKVIIGTQNSVAVFGLLR